MAFHNLYRLQDCGFGWWTVCLSTASGLCMDHCERLYMHLPDDDMLKMLEEDMLGLSVEKQTVAVHSIYMTLYT